MWECLSFVAHNGRIQELDLALTSKFRHPEKPLRHLTSVRVLRQMDMHEQSDMLAPVAWNILSLRLFL